MCVCVCVSAMVGLFLGRRLDKDLQVSDWESDCLSPAQLVYAATDAYATRQALIAARIFVGSKDSLSDPSGHESKVPYTHTQTQSDNSPTSWNSTASQARLPPPLDCERIIDPLQGLKFSEENTRGRTPT